MRISGNNKPTKRSIQKKNPTEFFTNKLALEWTHQRSLSCTSYKLLASLDNPNLKMGWDMETIVYKMNPHK